MIEKYYLEWECQKRKCELTFLVSFICHQKIELRKGVANHNYQERLLLSPAQMIFDNTSLLISNKDTISNQVCAPVKQSVLVSRQLNVNLNQHRKLQNFKCPTHQFVDSSENHYLFSFLII